jgi:hypothetical protein
MSKRNHHIQPNFYLKGFRSNPNEENAKIWVYEKGKSFYDGKTEQLQNPKHITTQKAARKKDFYAFVKEDGTKDYDKYENLLRDKFEEPAKPIIEKLRNFEMITDEEKDIFFLYVSSMTTRSEWAKNLHLKIVEDTAFSQNEEYQKVLKKEEHRSKINEIIVKSKDNLKHGESFPESIIKMAEKISNNFIKKMNWRFLIAPNNMPFLTSDKPVFYTKLDEGKCEIIFPISSQVMFSASWIDFTNKFWRKTENGFWLVNDESVTVERKCIVSIAIKEVYFSKKVKWLVEFVNRRAGTL